MINFLKKTTTLIYSLILFFSTMMFQNHLKINDPDLFWHIKTGEYIWMNKTIPHIDVLSWWGQGKELVWVSHEWLSDAVIYLLHQSIGFKGLLIATGITFLLLIYVLTQIMSLRIDKRFPYFTESKKVLVLTFFIFLISFSLAPFISIRPQIFSFLLISICILLYEKEKAWLTLPIILLGVNWHGGFWIIYLIIALYYSIPRKQYWVPILIILFSFATPHTYYNFLYPFLGTLDSTMANNISEWMPPKLFTSDTTTGMISIIILLMIFIPKKKIPLWDILFLTAFSIQMVRGRRFLLFFPLLGFIILLSYIDYKKIKDIFIKGIDFMSKKSDKNKIVLYNDSTIRDIMFIITIIVFLSAVFYMGMIGKNLTNSTEKDLINLMPLEAIEFLKENPEYQERLCNEYGLGGFLLFNDIPSMVDGRSDPFVETFNPDKDILADYFDSLYHFKESPENFFKEHDITNIIWKKNFKLYHYIRDNADFNIVYEDDNIFIAVYDK